VSLPEDGRGPPRELGQGLALPVHGDDYGYAPRHVGGRRQQGAAGGR
jgi:hypothetical protein